jgi:hypothetical protein
MVSPKLVVAYFRQIFSSAIASVTLAEKTEAQFGLRLRSAPNLALVVEIGGLVQIRQGRQLA